MDNSRLVPKAALFILCLLVGLAPVLMSLFVIGVPPARAVATITVPDDYPTIQAAIDAAASGDTIVVAAGTYTEKVTVNKAVTLRGANADVSAGATPGTRGPESIIQGGLVLQANGIIVNGFTIDGPAATGENAGIYIVGGTSGHTISNNILAGHGTAYGDGAALMFGYYTSDITVKNNDIGNWYHTYINPSSNLLIDGNNFHDNYVGIGSDGLSEVTLQYNKFFNNSLEGWGASSVGSNVQAHNNDFSGNGTAVANYSGAIIDATQNWWGDASGPLDDSDDRATGGWYNPDGLGDPVTDNVDYGSWLGSSSLDTTPPYTSGHDPPPGATTVPVNTNIVVHVQDDGYGVDQATITMTVEGADVTAELIITGTASDYTVTYDPPADFDCSQVVDVTVDASDLAGNAMTQDAYSFTTAAVAGPPATPTLISPEDGATVKGGTVTYEWYPVDGAVEYQLIVSTVDNPGYAPPRKCAVIVADDG
ncbi:MAG: hypothetical protein DRI39_09405, partial [Chloroflexi bacterium]